jgi:fluoroquinolone transport system permease protein
VTRLISTLRLDVLNQYRERFYFASALVLAVMGAVIGVLPPAAVAVLPAILLTNMLVATFVFLGGLLLLEKGQGTLEGLIVTPLKPGEYLLAKILSLTGLAVLENVVITAAARVSGLLSEADWGWVLIGSALSGAVYTLLGFLTVIRYDTLNEFLMPMIFATALLQLPALVCFGMPEYRLLYLLPTHGPLLMFQAALNPLPPATMIYAVLYPSAWILVSFSWGRRALRRFVTGGIGKS